MKPKKQGLLTQRDVQKIDFYKRLVDCRHSADSSLAFKAQKMHTLMTKGRLNRYEGVQNDRQDRNDKGLGRIGRQEINLYFPMGA